MSHNSPIPFRPGRWLANGHVQTLAAYFLSDGVRADRPRPEHVLLADGDQVVIHDDRPGAWRPGGLVALLVHGLCGCHQSGYMRRIAAKLVERGVRVFRLDMRGCGAGAALAQHPMHSDRTSDVAAVLTRIDELCPGSPVRVVGFSLGGNLVLNSAAVLGGAFDNFERALAICPPIDLVASSRFMHRPAARLYERHFVQLLVRQVRDRPRLRPDLPPIPLPGYPRSLAEFDDWVTAPLSGYASGDDYYRRTSPAPRLASIKIPTTIVAATNDPVVPRAPYEEYARSPRVELEIVPGGGHLGFISRGGEVENRRWLDWRVVNWVTDGGN